MKYEVRSQKSEVRSQKSLVPTLVLSRYIILTPGFWFLTSSYLSFRSSGGIVNTGQGALRTTFSASLPMMK